MLNYCKIHLDFIKFTGNDRLDLINRLSTNKVDILGKYNGIKTILTSDKGRFIDLLVLYNFGDFVFAACSFNNSNAVINHLDKYTVIDDFKATDLTGTHQAVLFYGEDAGNYAKELFGTDIYSFSNNDFEVINENEKDSMIARNDDAFGGFIFICSSKDYEYYNNKLFNEHVKQNFKLREISEEEYEKERIKLGIPKFGREITEDANPLECGFENYVSFTKGCYTGQEVIARLDTYDKISRHLVKLEFSGELPVNLLPGDVKLITDDKECGFVTSYVYAETKKYIGLGFIKTAFLDFNKPYFVKFNNIAEKCKIEKIK